MKFHYTNRTKVDVESSVIWYEKQQRGLEYKFLVKVETYIKWIKHNSKTVRILQRNYRRINLKLFGFNIPYMIHNNTLWILTVVHKNSHRKPNYWVEGKYEI